MRIGSALPAEASARSVRRADKMTGMLDVSDMTLSTPQNPKKSRVPVAAKAQPAMHASAAVPTPSDATNEVSHNQGSNDVGNTKGPHKGTPSRSERANLSDQTAIWTTCAGVFLVAIDNGAVFLLPTA